MEVQGNRAKVELGEGVVVSCELGQAENVSASTNQPKTADVGSLSAMLAAKWKRGASSEPSKETARAGQVRSFRISNLDPAKKLIELELAS